MRCETFDHILVGTPDLARTVEGLQRNHHVAPAFGGRHPAHGTSNYVMRLGRRSYAEFLGPDGGDAFDEVGTLIRALPGERLVGVAFETMDLDTTATKATALGLQLGPIHADARDTPEGDRLGWRAALFDPAVFPGLLVFAIEWGGASHPSLDAPDARLEALTIVSPSPNARAFVHDLMESRVDVQAGPVARLCCTIGFEGGGVSYRSDVEPVVRTRPR